MSTTHGQELNSSAKINSLLDNLVEQAMAHSQRIQGVKPPDPALEPHMKKTIDAIGAVRGRPL